MKKNVVILTSGLTGSSLLTGLITRAGYWVGSYTFKKSDYETYENGELIELNMQLFKEAGYRGNYTREFSAEAVQRIASIYQQVDLSRYRSFLNTCNENAPWIWKDPRLWLTIRFWKNLIDMNNISFILLTREHLQSWVSIINRRDIQSYAYSKQYSVQINDCIVQFFHQNNVPYFHLCFEDILTRPVKSLEKLNNHLGLNLGIDDLTSIYKKPLYRKSRGTLDFLKAILIYSKNYSERYG